MSRARIEFVRHAAALIYAADLARTIERAQQAGRPDAVHGLIQIASDRAVKSAVALADALDAAGFKEAT